MMALKARNCQYWSYFFSQGQVISHKCPTSQRFFCMSRSFLWIQWWHICYHELNSSESKHSSFQNNFIAIVIVLRWWEIIHIDNPRTPARLRATKVPVIRNIPIKQKQQKTKNNQTNKQIWSFFKPLKFSQQTRIHISTRAPHNRRPASEADMNVDEYAIAHRMTCVKPGWPREPREPPPLGIR